LVFFAGLHSVLLTYTQLFVAYSWRLRELIKEIDLDSFPSLKSALEKNETAYHRLRNLMFDEDGEWRYDMQAKHTKVEWEKRREYCRLLRYHESWVCVFGKLNDIREAMRSDFKDRNNVSIEVYMAVAFQHKELVHYLEYAEDGIPLFTAEETGLPGL
jgi:hypothetical protein